MIFFVFLRVICGWLLFSVTVAAAQETTFLGFDRNDYPGEANLAVLRRTFSYVGYWLNDPPGEKTNTWIGKRSALESAGFGFLVLFNGRLSKELKRDSVILAQSDAQATIVAARREGFPTVRHGVLPACDLGGCARLRRLPPWRLLLGHSSQRG